MVSIYALSGILCISLFASFTNARKDPGAYLQDFSKVTSTISNEEIDCHASDKASTPKSKTSYTKEFEPRPNISAYTDDEKTEENKSFVKDFEPRPNISAYADDDKTDENKSFVKDFEPSPNISAYADDEKTDENKSFIKDFEPRPNISAYTD
ncbi:hypothetical protein ABFS83_14G112400 [Erythranthe nasuta]